MRKIIITALIVFSAILTHAQSLWVYPTAPIAPIGTIQTVTAYIDGVNNKTASWTITGSPGGSTPVLVGANPCVVNEPCTIGLQSTTAGTYTLQAKSIANSSIVATSTIVLTAAPTATTGHPRLIITSAMLPALKAKTTGGNPMYQQLLTWATGFYSSDSSIFGWPANCGLATPSSGQDAGAMMQHAQLYALMGLIDPTDPTYNWNCYGHDTGVYGMTQLYTGAQTVTGNTWSDQVDYLALAPDWLMGSGAITSSTDITLVRNYAAFMLKNTMTTQTTYGTYGPYNNWNTPSQISNVGNLRIFGNNYTMTRMEYLAALSLTFDDNTTDDPPLTNTCSATRYQVCSDFSAGSLHAYAAYFEGSMLLNMYAHDEDPGVVNDAFAAAYSGFSGYSHSNPFLCGYYSTNVPCFGDGRDGESAEGSWYSYSVYRLRYAMNILHSTGYDKPSAPCLGATIGSTCPQLSLVTSSWWDNKTNSDINFLDGWTTPQTYQQPAFGFFNTGDANQIQRWPNDFETEVAELTDDYTRGRTDRSNEVLWAAYFTALGGPNGTTGTCSPSYYCGLIAGMASHFANSLVFDLFISQPATNPVSGTLPTDPRPSLPPDTFQGGFTQHLEVHSGTGSGWGNTESTFGYYCMNSITDHEHSPCGRYDIVSSIGGTDEYIIHGRSDYADYSYLGTTAINSGIPQLYNSLASCGSTFQNLQANGGQWWYSQQQSVPILISHSELPNYVATDVNDTGMYNSNSGGPCNGASDITNASRSLLYLRNLRMVFTYDRTASGSSRDKVNAIIASGHPTLSGHTATWTTPSGNQKAAWTSLLPSAITPTLTNLMPITITNFTVASGTATVNLSTPLPVNYIAGANVYIQGTGQIDNYYTINAITGANSFTVTGASGVSGTGGTAVVDLYVNGGYYCGTQSYCEPYVNSRINVDAGSTTAANFLACAQWGASTFTPGTCSLVQSTAGQGYDGAVLGTALVAFMRTIATPTGTTLPASGATTAYIANLTPNTSYAVTATGAPSTCTTDNDGVCTFSLTGTGNLVVGSAAPPTVPYTISGTHVSGVHLSH